MVRSKAKNIPEEVKEYSSKIPFEVKNIINCFGGDEVIWAIFVLLSQRRLVSLEEISGILKVPAKDVDKLLDKMKTAGLVEGYIMRKELEKHPNSPEKFSFYCITRRGRKLLKLLTLLKI